jgi:lipoyl-dependent peroxiredoxin
MSLANLLGEAGFPPQDLRTTVRVRLEQKDEGFRITRISVTTVGEVPGVDQERFVALAEEAKAMCPVSLALAGTDITLEASLQSLATQGVDE